MSFTDLWQPGCHLFLLGAFAPLGGPYRIVPAGLARLFGILLSISLRAGMFVVAPVRVPIWVRASLAHFLFHAHQPQLDSPDGLEVPKSTGGANLRKGMLNGMLRIGRLRLHSEQRLT
jgi:hypothetical protein